jgi:hypothetical protein
LAFQARRSAKLWHRERSFVISFRVIATLV